ncbi:UNVERIFIED_CONTAM: hypothetical protein Scaly_0998800, partial [Sesamum calycinum]
MFFCNYYFVALIGDTVKYIGSLPITVFSYSNFNKEHNNIAYDMVLLNSELVACSLKLLTVIVYPQYQGVAQVLIAYHEVVFRLEHYANFKSEFEKKLLAEANPPPGDIGVTIDGIGAFENVKKTLKELVMLPRPRPILFGKGLLTKMIECENSDLNFVRRIVGPMKEKFDKYWKQCCLVLVVAVSLIPDLKWI